MSVLIVHNGNLFIFQMASDLHRDGSDECWKDQNHPLDLHELLSEIRNLRSQLERSIKANKTLHEKLEEQLVRGKQAKASSGSAMSINYLVKQESQLNGTSSTGLNLCLWLTEVSSCPFHKNHLLMKMGIDRACWLFHLCVIQGPLLHN